MRNRGNPDGREVKPNRPAAAFEFGFTPNRSCPNCITVEFLAKLPAVIAILVCAGTVSRINPAFHVRERGFCTRANLHPSLVVFYLSFRKRRVFCEYIFLRSARIGKIEKELLF